jgi:hypothetical protein
VFVLGKHVRLRKLNIILYFKKPHYHEL